MICIPSFCEGHKHIDNRTEEENDMICQMGNIWVLDTGHTTYCFGLLPTGQLEHLYYGPSIVIESEAEAEVLR